ncbi:hypothetical protein BT63DRAFT_45684 [Microthyrium microscopicum]|uniref:Uncharacterized protein n=1 Tax=Microthyrium microscopicum TaxID=703497 RepID=A0A6A6U3G7_9PEZI|nr:hypothetical protein BT63DRAFT_45684 [Microthyrium microscopicum]
MYGGTDRITDAAHGQERAAQGRQEPSRFGTGQLNVPSFLLSMYFVEQLSFVLTTSPYSLQSCIFQTHQSLFKPSVSLLFRVSFNQTLSIQYLYPLLRRWIRMRGKAH